QTALLNSQRAAPGTATCRGAVKEIVKKATCPSATQLVGNSQNRLRRRRQITDYINRELNFLTIHPGGTQRLGNITEYSFHSPQPDMRRSCPRKLRPSESAGIRESSLRR